MNEISEPARLMPMVSPGGRPRFLSEAACRELLGRIARVSEGGGTTGLMIWSTWTGNVRWARNHLTTTGEVRNDYIRVTRRVDGAENEMFLINDTSDAALVAAARDAERLGRLEAGSRQGALYRYFQEEPTGPTVPLFFDTTYTLDATRRAAAAQQLMHAAVTAGMLSAGYIEVAAHGLAVLDTAGHERYCDYTTARYSVTVRTPDGTGSGWAGIDWPDWDRIDGEQLSAIALDKCLKSRTPVAIEPGRYTTILEPQAVGDLIGPLFDKDGGIVGWPGTIDVHRPPPDYPYLIGRRLIDPRITITASPIDPDMAFPPFNPIETMSFQAGMNLDYAVYHPVTWVEHGVLVHQAYSRDLGVEGFGEDTGLPNAGAFRMSGGTTTIAEMIATTERGLLVTRFDQVKIMDERSQLYRGFTRDGLWLVEHGKISKAVKNLTFTDSPLFALNNIEQLGVPQRVFHPKSGSENIRTIPQPIIVPPLKVKDFSFTALVDAV